MRIPAPQSITPLSFELILLELKTDLINRDPTLADTLNTQSASITKLLENFAYRELHLRQQINDGIKATMIPLAVGANLDNLLVLFGVSRLELIAADNNANPPIEQVLETDDDFRKRGLLALEAYSSAGPAKAYIYHGLSVAGVFDITATSPSNGVVNIVIMANDGVANADLIAAVRAQLNDEKIRPLGTQLNIATASAVNYTITATLNTDNTAAAALALTNATAAINAYILSRFKINKTIYRTGILAALHQAGVESVNLTEPAADIVINAEQFANNTAVSITLSQ